ncbi:hypothetical protein LguiA_000052 [Lonicera macranthoides]
MTILGWMHRKFRQNSTEPHKDFAVGHSCTCLMGQPSLDDQQYCPKPNFCNKPFSKTHRDNHLRKSFASLEAARAEEEEFKEESSASLSELFHGFLAIGTLGTDSIISDPSTPTFAISVENIMEKETEVTENELKLINYELEKILGDDACTDSSGRNSHVSTGRSSHGSAITLSGKQMEDTENNGNGTIMCPLQGYLFGSAIELPETATAKQEHRTSLGELFQKTKITEEGGAKCDRAERRTDKDSDKSAVHIMKKLLKRRMLHTFSRTSTPASGGTIDSASAETKLNKVLQMFHRKVHPESTVAREKVDNATKNKIRSNNDEGGYNNGDWMHPGEDITIFPQRSLSKKRTRHVKSHSNSPQLTHGRSNSSGNSEYWIKTDADYLVLEL